MLGAKGYDERFLHFVECVRRDTGRPNLPFLYVQIGRYALDYSPQAKEWELLRELQRRAASSVPNLYMVSAIDLPLGDSIHLSYEGQERLGKRLAEVALTNVYGVKDHGSRHRPPVGRGDRPGRGDGRSVSPSVGSAESCERQGWSRVSSS